MPDTELVSRPGIPAAPRAVDGSMAEGSRSYVLITGNGRSGSNRLLDIFDCHEASFCRSEPMDLAGGPLRALPRRRLALDGSGPAFLPAWRAALAEESRRHGVLDHFGMGPKSFFRSRMHQRLYGTVFGRRRLTRLWLALQGRSGDEQWPLPGAFLDRDAFDASLPVLKIGAHLGWILPSHAADAGQCVVHNIRAPDGYLRSWFNRYVIVKDRTEVYARNMKRLPHILRTLGASWPHGDAPTDEALFDSELWYWRYVNEMLHARLGQSPRYRLVTFEAIDRDPEGVGRALFGFVGLDFTEVHAARIRGLRNEIFAAGHRVAVDPALVAGAIARVCTGSAFVAGIYGDTVRAAVGKAGAPAGVAG